MSKPPEWVYTNGNLIREHRGSTTRPELALKSGLSKKTIYNIEKGYWKNPKGEERPFSYFLVDALAGAFGPHVDTNELIDWERTNKELGIDHSLIEDPNIASYREELVDALKEEADTVLRHRLHSLVTTGKSLWKSTKSSKIVRPLHFAASALADIEPNSFLRREIRRAIIGILEEAYLQNGNPYLLITLADSVVTLVYEDTNNGWSRKRISRALKLSNQAGSAIEHIDELGDAFVLLLTQISSLLRCQTQISGLTASHRANVKRGMVRSALKATKIAPESAMAKFRAPDTPNN